MGQEMTFRRLTPGAVADFHRDGFLLGEAVLDWARMEELRGEIDRVIAEAGDDPPSYAADKPPFITNLSGRTEHPVWQVVNIWSASDAFRRLLAEPAIVEAVSDLTGARVLRVWHDQVQLKPPRHGGTNGWHQDAPLWPPLSPCGAAGDGTPAQVTAWIALDDADERNGCMTMARGSHTWGNRITDILNRRTLSLEPPAGERLELMLRPVPAGHVHFHHALTWHCSHGNQTSRPRRAIAIHYMTDATTYAHPSQGHPMERFIESEPGAVVAGSVFPVVFDAPGAGPDSR
ncbi:MAG TPA: phytanoyl-CoA dioxygenase family protein [Acidimicrobiales bacterium]|nr:phytanoyl-CoA dioxygenase family protein [Acidimicrobiales bacterium]